VAIQSHRCRPSSLDRFAFAHDDDLGSTKSHLAPIRRRRRARAIVSEASRRLPESFRHKHPELPWKQIMGIGNVLRHDYDTVVDAIVWETTHEGLGPLPAVVVAEIEALDPKS